MIQEALKYLVGLGVNPKDAIRDVHGASIAIVPEGHQAIDLSKFIDANREFPRRKEATVKLGDAASFIAYWKKHHTEDSVVFANNALDSLSFCAIFDYHGAPEKQAGWAKHRATFTLTRTAEWNTWMARNGDKNAMSQKQFCDFIENNAIDVINPPGASLLEMSLDLQIKKSTSYTGAIRLSNGKIKLDYNEDVRGTTMNGQTEIPDTFTLRLKPFVGSPVYELQARLRYRLTDGELSFWFDIVRPHKIVEQAFNDTLALISKDLGTTVLIGGI